MAKKTTIVTHVTRTEVWNRDDMASLIDMALQKHAQFMYPKFWDTDDDEDVTSDPVGTREQQVLDLKVTDVTEVEALIWAVIRRKSFFLLGKLTIANLGWLVYKLFGSNLNAIHDPYLFEVYETFKERSVLVAETKNQARALEPHIRNVGNSAFLLAPLLELAVKRYKQERRELNAREAARIEKQAQLTSKVVKEAINTLVQTSAVDKLLHELDTQGIIDYIEKQGYDVTAARPVGWDR